MKKQPPNWNAIVYKRKIADDYLADFLVIPLHEVKDFEKSDHAQNYLHHSIIEPYAIIDELLNSNNWEAIRARIMNANKLPF